MIKNYIRGFVLLVFNLALSGLVHAQVDVSGFDEQLRMDSLHYTTEQFANRFHYRNRAVLHGQDSSYILGQIKSQPATVINTYGGSPFGDMDQVLEVYIDDIKEVALLAYVDMSDFYLVHLMLEDDGGYTRYGILATLNNEGYLIDWCTSDGASGAGNPNGTVSRDFTIRSDGTVQFVDYSWGRNNIHYSFEGLIRLSTADEEYGVGSFVFEKACIEYH